MMPPPFEEPPVVLGQEFLDKGRTARRRRLGQFRPHRFGSRYTQRDNRSADLHCE